MGTFNAKFVQATVTATTLNPKPLMLTNGTSTDSAMAKASETLPNWATQVAAYNIGIENRTISSFSRVNGNDNDYDD